MTYMSGTLRGKMKSPTPEELKISNVDFEKSLDMISKSGYYK